MKAVIKRFHSPDIDFESYTPSGNNWAFLLQVIVGPSDKDGEESLDVMVCSSAWLTNEVKRVGILSGLHYLVVSDYSKIKSYIESYVSTHGVGDNWEEIAEKLGKLGYWEFDNYLPQK